VRIRAKRGHQVAAVALARKLTVLCWHLLTKEQDYLWARPALVAKKARDMELRAGLSQKKGNRRGPAYALMSFCKDYFTPIAAPGHVSVYGRPVVGTRSEDVGEQALVRGLDTA